MYYSEVAEATNLLTNFFHPIKIGC